MKTVVAAYAYWMAKDKIKVNRKEKKKKVQSISGGTKPLSLG